MQHKPTTTAHLRVFSQNFSTQSIQGEIYDRFTEFYPKGNRVDNVT